MRTIVHVLGESDLGIDTTGLHAIAPEVRLQRVKARVEHLGALPPSDALGLAVRPDLIFSRGQTALGKAFTHLGLECDRLADEVELLLVTTTTNVGHPLGLVASFVSKQLDCLGVVVRLLETGASFDLIAIAKAVRAALMEEYGFEAPQVVVLWGGGATELALGAVSGAVDSGRSWSLLGVESAVAQPLDLVPEHRVPAAVTWAVRFGHPEHAPANLGLFGPLDERQAAVARHVELLAKAAAGVADGGVDAGSLAAWAMVDLRRGDALSGSSIRRWIEVKYEATRRAAKHQKRPQHSSLFDLSYQLMGHHNTIVDVQRMVAERVHDTGVQASAASPAGRWLLGDAVRGVLASAAEATHELRPLPSEQRSAALGLLPAQPPPPQLLGPFAPPRGHVGLIWSDGRTVGGRVGGLATLLHRPVGPELNQWISLPVGGAPTASVLVLATDQSMPAALLDQTRAAADAIDHPAFRLDGDTVITECSPDDVSAYRMATAWFEPGGGLQRELDAVVLLPTGPKPLVRGLLRAALEYGTRHAVPVFVQSLADGDAGSGARYHRLGSYLENHTALLTMVELNMNRLAFDVAARLLRLGRPEWSQLADEASALSEAVVGHDGGATIRDRLTVCELALRRRELSRPDQLRIVLIAAEIIGVNPDGLCSRAVRWCRNRLPVAHGDVGVDQLLTQLREVPAYARLDPVIEALADLVAAARGEQPGGNGPLARRLEVLRVKVASEQARELERIARRL